MLFYLENKQNPVAFEVRDPLVCTGGLGTFWVVTAGAAGATGTSCADSADAAHAAAADRTAARRGIVSSQLWAGAGPEEPEGGRRGAGGYARRTRARRGRGLRGKRTFTRNVGSPLLLSTGVRARTPGAVNPARTLESNIPSRLFSLEWPGRP